MATPSFYKQGLTWLAALVVGGALAIGGALTVTGNTTLTNLSVTDNATATTVVVGSGKHLNFLTSNVDTLDFGVIPPQSCAELPLAVTGSTTATSDVEAVSLGLDPGLDAYATNTSWTGFVSAADTVTVKGCNADSASTSDVAALPFRATVSRIAQ